MYAALDNLDPVPNKWRDSMKNEIRKAEVMRKLKIEMIRKLKSF